MIAGVVILCVAQQKNTQNDETQSDETQSDEIRTTTPERQHQNDNNSNADAADDADCSSRQSVANRNELN